MIYFSRYAINTSQGFMERVRTIFAISGASWATGVYTYYQPGRDGAARDDAQLLGEWSRAQETYHHRTITVPALNHHCAITVYEDLSPAMLSAIDPKGMLSAAQDSFARRLLGALGQGGEE